MFLLRRAMKRVTRELQREGDIAWAWQCMVACCVMDALPHGPGVHQIANRAAAQFMRMAYEVDITKHPHWASFEDLWAKQ
jgi:hypothetical protein